MIVTGSLIPSADEVTATPVDTLGQREIARSGSVQVLEILQRRVADITGSNNIGSTNANSRAPVTLGGASVSIRGLPTLTLYEGRRIADAAAIAAGGLPGGVGFTDVSLFPTSLISRIEVLKDGASALYGSDAVGGVINIFLKHDFKGVEVGYRYGFTPTSGTQDTLVYVIAGSGNEKTNITVGYQYFQSSGLFQRERAYSNPQFPLHANYGGVIFDPGARDSTGNVVGQYYLLAPGLNSPFEVPGVAPGSQSNITSPVMANAYVPVLPGHTAQEQETFLANRFNIGRVPTSVLIQFNQNALAAFSHEIIGKRLELFGNFLYADNRSASTLNAQPLTAIMIPAGQVGTGLSPTIFNPFLDPITGNGNVAPSGYEVRNRYVDVPRTYSFQTNFYRFLTGLRSQLSSEYSVEAAFYYSNYHTTYINSGELNGIQYDAMVAGTARDRSGNLIPPLDPFALNPIGTNPGQVSAGQFATLYGSNLRELTSYQRVFDLKLTGFPFKLPAGPFGFALGGEHRRDGFGVSDSPEIFTDSIMPIKDFVASRAAYAVYLELSIPIVSPSMKVPGIYSMDISLAGRHEKYEGISTAANVPKVTFRYQPFKDLTLRATYANSFVAPNLYQLYGPLTVNFDTQIPLPTGPGPNPVLGTPNSNEVTGRNPQLVPSTSQSYTAGAVFSPSWCRGLTISADYFNVLQQNVVDFIGSDIILSSVNRFVSSSPYYSRVHIGSLQGALVPAMTAPFALANTTDNLYVDNRFVNIGALRKSGWDFSIAYTAELGRYGTLQLGANAVYYVTFEARRLVNTPYLNFKGRIGDEFFGNNPAYRVNSLAEYRYRGWTLGFTGFYNPAVQNLFPNPSRNPARLVQVVPDFFQVDARLSYSFSRSATATTVAGDGKGAPRRAPVVSQARWYDGVTLTVGCNNVFNQQPPFIILANSNTDLSTYDPFGRLVYFEVSKRF